MSERNLYDMHGIPIERGDVLKVYHFTGRNRKRHFMYKQCLGFHGVGPSRDVPYLKFSHLDLDDAYYLESPDGRVLTDYEIVQSIDCRHDERPHARTALRSRVER